ncbi:MAG: fatty acid desaturase [Streptomyces sp.]|nr:fatty acid desaturase [Streptomyces sp.]
MTIPDSATNRSLSRAEIRATVKHLRTEVDGTVFLVKFAVFLVLTGLGGVLAMQSFLAAQIGGTILLGLMFAHAAELQHQTLHSLGLRNRAANTAAGVALGIPMLISFAAYRASHLRHHRDLGTPQNREFFDYGDQYGSGTARSRWAVPFSWLVRFSMFHHYLAFCRNEVRALRGADMEGENATTSRRIRRDHHVILAVVAVLAAVSAVTDPLLILRVWVIPLVLVAAPVHAAIELPEHFRCETLDQDPFANTRTIRSNRLMMWFTNGNNFHVEHHLMPNLPIERLPDLHAEVSDSLRYYHRSYVRYFRDLVKGR